MNTRKLKTEVADLLMADDLSANLEKMAELPEKKTINLLFSFFYSSDQLVKWHAVSAAGFIVSRITAHDMAYARNIMRRLMWNMNDESGGIGWGSAEAMGEIMAGNKILADEYHRILISYVMPHGNFIENEHLQKGILWGIGRLAHAMPDLLEPYAKLIVPFMKSHNSVIRGLAAWIGSLYSNDQVKSVLKDLEKDAEKLSLYVDGRLDEVRVGELAKGH